MSIVLRSGTVPEPVDESTKFLESKILIGFSMFISDLEDEFVTKKQYTHEGRVLTLDDNKVKNVAVVESFTRGRQAIMLYQIKSMHKTLKMHNVSIVDKCNYVKDSSASMDINRVFTAWMILEQYPFLSLFEDIKISEYSTAPQKLQGDATVDFSRFFDTKIERL